MIANKADINAPAREDGSAPLHFAAMSGSVDCVQILIDNKADVNARSFALYTPLHDAVGVGAVECAKLLLDNGANVNSKNKVNIHLKKYILAIKSFLLILFIWKKSILLSKISFCQILLPFQINN